MEMRRSYLSSLNITLGNAVEAITARKIPEELVNNGHVLSLFEQDIDGIIRDEKKQSILNVKRFIIENKTTLAEEDLGGVSELFSGHRAIWKDEEVKLVHDPARRDAGKIYTPYDVTHYMCSNVAKAMISRCGSLEELLKMKVLDPAVGSGAFCSQLVRVLWKKASRKWKLKDEAQFRHDICR
jgi:type I restriction-modification system DNA methylase subunit